MLTSLFKLLWFCGFVDGQSYMQFFVLVESMFLRLADGRIALLMGKFFFLQSIVLGLANGRVALLKGKFFVLFQGIFLRLTDR